MIIFFLIAEWHKESQKNIWKRKKFEHRVRTDLPVSLTEACCSLCSACWICPFSCSASLTGTTMGTRYCTSTSLLMPLKICSAQCSRVTELVITLFSSDWLMLAVAAATSSIVTNWLTNRSRQNIDLEYKYEENIDTRATNPTILDVPVRIVRLPRICRFSQALDKLPGCWEDCTIARQLTGSRLTTICDRPQMTGSVRRFRTFSEVRIYREIVPNRILPAIVVAFVVWKVLAREKTKILLFIYLFV